MSASKTVFSFFDPAEINKSFSDSKALSQADESPSNGGITKKPPSPHSHTSPTNSHHSSSSYVPSPTGSHSSRSSSRRSPAPSPQSKPTPTSIHPNEIPTSSTGEISISYSKSQDSCNSQITERANNKSPEVPRMNHVMTRSTSNASSGVEGSIVRATSAASLGRVVSGCGTTREANYEEGASELFLLVEGAAWQEAITRVNQFPEEAKVWINSSGTENTVFSWSVWRRLPLHEACRRQPPPVLIYALLAAYPQSTSAESHFGELPLHAAVRCGACAEVVNCLLAAYPAAVFARDNSGCTPLDILNGTGKMMDHDAVVAALTRTIAVLTKEENEWNAKIKSMEREFAADKEMKRREHERMVETKNGEIEALRRELEQEKLATSNLAKKVIQTEKVVELKSSLETRYQERLKKCEEDIKTLKTLNAGRKAKIKEIEAVTVCDKDIIAKLNARVEQLQVEMTAICAEEETFVASTVSRAEAKMKVLMEAQLVFMKENEKKKDRLRGRLGRLGITLPPKKFPSDFDEAEPKKEDTDRERDMSEPTDEEVMEKAFAAAMKHFSMSEESSDSAV